jgi:hypothetical protein
VRSIDGAVEAVKKSLRVRTEAPGVVEVEVVDGRR